MNPNDKRPMMITCPPGLGEYLRQEVEALGYCVEAVLPAGVKLQGNLYDAMRLNLYLYTAYNVLILLKQFECRSPEELYREVKDFPWEDLISPSEYLSVIGRTETETIDNSMYASLKVKDAVVDRITEKTGSRPNSGSDKTGVVLQVYWKDNFCRLFLNTSGQKLSDRGYRKIPHKAPLRETLAAVIIKACGYDGTMPLVCPMCGSGTLAIEAALMASHRVPGLLRSNFGFMHIKSFDPAAWQEIRTAAAKQGKKRGGKADVKSAAIIATDIDIQAIEAARRNAMTAGVDHLISFEVCDFADTPMPPGPGIIVMNPEYGQRMGEIEKLKLDYHRIGDFFKQKCAGYTGYVFTGNPDLAKQIGLRTSRKMIFFNAQIECRLLKYELYAGSRKNRPE